LTRFFVRPLAERDIDDVADYYAREANLDVAVQFLRGVDEACERLRRHPQSGTLVKAASPRLSGLRFCLVPGFESYVLFHLSAPDCVEVVRVLHGARDLERILEGLAPEE